jgi:hypothetical protein
MEVKNLADYYAEGQDFLRPRKERQVRQLVLLNNLQRGDQNIASTTLFSLFNRLHSSLYSDVLTVKFIPTEDSDYKKVELLNKLQQNDYREMEKWKLDYDWLWNTAFYGDGFVETANWDKERKMMMPEVLNNLMMIYDPFFSEPKDWRYYGYWITRPKHKLIQLQKAGLLELGVELDRLQGGFDTEVWSYKTTHDQARNVTPIADSSTSNNNQIYQIFEMKAYDDDGKRYSYWVDKNFSKILRKKKLDLDDDEGWQIVRKQVFREPNSSVSISVPDIVEDKHRAKSVLLNLMYMGAKDEANPTYVYNKDLVNDVSVFFNRQIEQHIPVDDVDRAVKRLNLGPAVSASLLQFFSLLNNESTDAIGTTMVQPIVPRGKKSATESAIIQQVADLAASLQSKILGIGEKEFWSKWYLMHLKNMGDAEKKSIVLTNVSTDITTTEWVELKDIKTKFPPKSEILSQRDADYKELVIRRDWMQVFQPVIEGMNPKSKNDFMKFVFLPHFIKDSSTIDRIIPKGIDEIMAQQENELLDIDKLPTIRPSDDDETHLYIHYMAKNTSATWTHRFVHEQQYAEKKKKQDDMQQQMMAQQAQKPIKNNTANNMEGAAPLAQETGDDLARMMGGNMK